jgi:hypothetical protein
MHRGGRGAYRKRREDGQKELYAGGEIRAWTLEYGVWRNAAGDGWARASGGGKQGRDAHLVAATPRIAASAPWHIRVYTKRNGY